MRFTKAGLEKIYSKYNRREFVHPDPLEFLYQYNGKRDREIVALIASSLAYGRVQQILRSVTKVLTAMGPPAEFVGTVSEPETSRLFRRFKHRFTTGAEIAALLSGIGRILDRYGSLNECFVFLSNAEDETVLPALTSFAQALQGACDSKCETLIPNPQKGSACKRLNLFLRWMVRKDDVDPGGWNRISTQKLIVPLDTHMHRIALKYGLTERKAADLRAALEVTRAFARFSPEDPVRYDFALTRPGIQGRAVDK
jgi:uncharacterized protein (TIGR02757 family)